MFSSVVNIPEFTDGLGITRSSIKNKFYVATVYPEKGIMWVYDYPNPGQRTEFPLETTEEAIKLAETYENLEQKRQARVNQAAMSMVRF